MSAIAGFLLAASLRGNFQPGLFIALVVGTSLVIACGCVINNYIDRGLDRHMARTKKRALAVGKIHTANAIAYGVGLGIAGFAILLAFTNNLTALVGLIGLFFYLVMYSFWKRRSWLGTVIGSISGATPIAAGYTAVTGHFDSAALTLFLTMVFWQMPHFYAIAMYRLKDYRAAGLPVLPVKKGFRRTKLEMLLYITAFTIAAVALTIEHYTGYVYMAVMLIIGLYWLQDGIAGFGAPDETKWARHMFFLSLIALLVFCASLSVGALLP